MQNKLNCILLVDDDEPTNFLHRRVIEKADCAERIDVAESGREALDYLCGLGRFADPASRCSRPDLVLLDINMPHMDGWEFMAEYRKLPPEQKAELVIAMLTTSLNPDDEQRARDSGVVDEFMIKPLTVKMMTALIARHWPQMA